jgi:SAM-dependent methyltransferase
MKALRATLGRYLGWTLAVAMLGRRIECPLCGWRFRRLRAFGRVRRADALCPRCGSLERTRLLWLYLERETDVGVRPQSLLHIAPEPAISRRLRRIPTLAYVTGDLERSDVDMKLDITDLPLESERFDALICSHVLEHVPDDRRAIAELHRVLRPGGIAWMMVPVEGGRGSTFEDPTVTDPAERLRLFNQSDHVRVYGTDFPERLRAAGFEVSAIDYAKRLDPAVVARHALVERTASGEPNTFDTEIYECVRPPRRA